MNQKTCYEITRYLLLKSSQNFRPPITPLHVGLYFLIFRLRTDIFRFLNLKKNLIHQIIEALSIVLLIMFRYYYHLIKMFLEVIGDEQPLHVS